MTMQPAATDEQPSHSPLALLGGTFDPPHIGHLFLAECARLQFNAQTVLFLPAGDPYTKSGTTGLPTANSQLPTPAANRLAMVRLALAGNPNFAVDDREILRPGPSYTVDTLEELHAEGHTNLILILGADAFADLPIWKHPDRILELATIAVAPKPWQPEATVPDLSPSDRSGEENPYPEVMAELLDDARTAELIQIPPLAISSTLIRDRIASGQPVRYLVPEGVAAYIATHNLYTK